MYKKQIQIIYDKNNTNFDKGQFFEKLISNIFVSQRYSIKDRLNFTGMEIDLIAEHMDRKNELIYIECKAKNNLESIDIKSFVFNTKFKQSKYGYFISTSNFVHQVGGLIEEISQKEEYSNLYFWGPDKIIELLEESNTIKKLDTKIYNQKISKEIFAYTYFGVYRILIFSEHTLSSKFTVVNAENNSTINNDEIIQNLQYHIDELQELKYENFTVETNETVNRSEVDLNNKLEVVAEVKRSDFWYDYLPTSSKHFVGRKDILNEFNDFIKLIKNKEINKRVFYIDGKSGWGKSSLVSTIRDNSKKKKYKNSQFVFAVDTRSASTNTFIALAFKKMLVDAYQSGFLNDYKDINSIEIISSYDILGSQSIRNLLDYLEKNDKYLIIIFDQFEDIFRKGDIFKAFYKFLCDINNECSNIILGFSWKSEINVPIDNPAYYLWQEVKNETLSIEMREFDSKEVNGVIKQLQKSINAPLDSNIKRRIVEGSQGFPWLTKKLCIHTYNQLRSGHTIEDLLDQDLNIQSLFEKDLEGISHDEIKALKYIAKRAYDGEIFDAIEIDDVIENKILSELINKRLIVQSGSKYNIYWDIFRDYLVTDEIPVIGESYILRQSSKVCLDVFMAFKNNKTMTTTELYNLYSNRRSQKSLNNIVKQLIDINIISKEKEYLTTRCSSDDINREYFINFVRNKLERYTPLLKVKKSKNEIVSMVQIKKILQDTFKGNEFKESTWETYTKLFVGWINFVGFYYFDNLENYSFYHEGEKIIPSKKVKNQSNTFTPQKPITGDIKVFKDLIIDIHQFDTKNKNKFLYDLSAIGLLCYWGDNVILNREGKELSKIQNEKEFVKYFCHLAIKPYKIQKAIEYIKENNVENVKQFKKIASDLVEHINSEIYKNQTLTRIYNWSTFIISND